MAREHMQLWQQGRQMHPTVTNPVHSTVASPTVSVSAQNLQHPSQFQMSKPEGAAVPPLTHPQTQNWSSFSPVATTHGQQASSQLHAAAPLSHPHLPQTPTDDLTSGTDAIRPAQNSGDAHNSAEAQPHLENTAGSPVVTSTDIAPTPSALPSSQSASTQSILLASEEKGTALYTMRGLAASIKRSLNAERLAASMEEPASSDLHSQKRKRSSSIEAIDTRHRAKLSPPDLAVEKSYEQELVPKAEPQPVNIVSEPDDSAPTILPVSISEVSMPQQETVPHANGFQVSGSQHNSSHNFVPFSTLTGAVSFDNVADSVPVSHNPTPSSETTGVLEDLTTSQPTPQTVLHIPIEDPFVPVTQSSFNPLPFPHRTPTPPLAATITTLHDEGEVDGKAESTSSSHPSTILHETEIDSQLQLIPSGHEEDVEMSVTPVEDHVQTHFDIASSEISRAQDNDTLMQEADVFVRRAGSLDPSIEEIDRGTIGSPIVEYSGGETRSPPRAPEELAWGLTKTSPIRVQSTGSAEISGPSSMPKLPRKPRGKQEFYIAVPPASEWVLRAKRREAERKALDMEKAGEFRYPGTASYYFSCILGQCHSRGS
jgi:hypothetical protein